MRCARPITRRSSARRGFRRALLPAYAPHATGPEPRRPREKDAMHRRALLALPPLFAALAFVAPLALAQPLPTARPEEVGLNPQRLARIRPVLEAEVAEGRIPGAVVMIARRGRLAYAETIGARDKAANAPMAPDTI